MLLEFVRRTLAYLTEKRDLPLTALVRWKFVLVKVLAQKISRYREQASTDRYRGVLGVAEDPIVSSDIVGDPRASVVDAGMTRVVDRTLAKVMAWYDNEWGFAHQMIRQALAMLNIERDV